MSLEGFHGGMLIGTLLGNSGAGYHAGATAVTEALKQKGTTEIENIKIESENERLKSEISRLQLENLNLKKNKDKTSNDAINNSTMLYAAQMNVLNLASKNSQLKKEVEDLELSMINWMLASKTFKKVVTKNNNITESEREELRTQLAEATMEVIEEETENSEKMKNTGTFKAAINTLNKKKNKP